ncbi:RES family NAD+ phosphorylase [Methyloversatilis universalis]|uniref:RES family NAD+ phosphorylase n=1 Tax=Methyloversatilis universalis TaxID=378211 RepID=UPI0004757D61|nr:RES family NAD+ phosphorylase [Methyloversatilis universalis]
MSEALATVWRIGVDTPSYQASDLNGEGGKHSDGRWHRKGSPIVYAASSVSLACLETLVHLGPAGLPLNRYLVRIDVPESLIQRARVLTAETAGVGWDARPAGMVSMDHGDEWLASMDSALLVVPSVLVPEENNVLINPLHPDARSIAATKLRLWTYDPRLGAR